MFWAWLPLAVVVTMVAGLVQVAVQQNYRQSANDPQIQLAEDYVQVIADGKLIPVALSSSFVDIAKSLAPYTIIYNDKIEPVDGTGHLDGKLPTPPLGVFAAAKARGENRVTWQPRADVRQAIVVKPLSGEHPGFILAGRSLRELEIREKRLFEIVSLSWVMGILITLGLVILNQKKRS